MFTEVLPFRDTLASLSAYLTLQRAQEAYGFDPARYGLTDKEAAKIAGVFRCVRL